MKAVWMTALMAAAAVTIAPAPASAQQPTSFTLTAQLSGANEPPAPGINTGAFGNATVVVDLTAQTVAYTVTVFNLPSGVTASHIHVGAPGPAGPVVVNFTVPTTASNDFTFSGTVPFSQFVLRPDQGIRSSDDMVQAILGGNSYVNVHSQVNPGGEIRGQLVLKQ
jgi:hypothetical protein